VQGKWSGYSFLVLGLLRTSASLRAIHCYPYPEKSSARKPGSIFMKKFKLILSKKYLFEIHATSPS
jgi:hypothetical protein